MGKMLAFFPVALKNKDLPKGGWLGPQSSMASEPYEFGI
jgi:hypothetical protein